MDFHGFSLIFHKFHRFSLIFIGFSQIFKANRAGTLPAAAWRQLGTPLAAARRKLRGWQPSVWGRRLAGRVAGGTRRQVRTPLAQTLFGEKPYENRGPKKKKTTVSAWTTASLQGKKKTTQTKKAPYAKVQKQKTQTKKRKAGRG